MLRKPRLLSKVSVRDYRYLWWPTSRVGDSNLFSARLDCYQLSCLMPQSEIQTTLFGKREIKQAAHEHLDIHGPLLVNKNDTT